MKDQTDTPKSYHHGDLRAALLRAAEAELEASGIEGFSLRKVAKRAGVSHAAPAHHFRDTRGLLTALAARGFRRLLEMLEEQASADGSTAPGPRLLSYGHAYVAFAQTHTALFRLCFSSRKPDDTDPELEQAGADAYLAMANLVAERAGSDLCETALDAAAVWAMVHGIADLMASGKMKDLQTLSPEDLDSTISALLTRALPPLA